jgi:hypothetical protein
MAGACVRKGCSPHGGQEAEQKEGIKDQVQPSRAHTHSDLLLPIRSYLLKFLKPPKIVPPGGDLAFNT